MAENYTKIIEISLKSDDLIKNLAEIRIQQEAIKKSQSELNEQYKQGKISQDDYATATAKNTETTKALNAQARQYSSELQNNVKIAKSAEEAYNKLAAQYANNVAKMDAMSKAQLTQTAEGKTLTEQTSKLRQEMISLKEQQGNHTLSVGNYAKAFNGLNVSVSQIVRELPNAAQSSRIFFMAISNNIATLGDSIQQARAQNAVLQAQGEKTTPVWKQVAGALFSWQSALMLGVTAMTIFGPKIVDLIAKLFKVSDSLNVAKLAQEGFNKVNEDYTKNVAKDLAHLDLLYKASQNQKKSLDERKEAINQLKKEYPEYFGQMTTEEILAGKTSQAYLALRSSLIEVARARAAEKVIGEYQEKILRNEIELTNKNNQLNNDAIELVQRKADLKQQETNVMLNFAKALGAVSTETEINATTKPVESLNNRIRETKKEVKSLTDENKSYASVIETIAKSVNITGLDKQDSDSGGKTKISKKIKEVSDKMDELAEKYFDLSKISIPENLKIDDKELFPEDETWEEQKKRISDHLKQLEESYKLQILMAGDSEKAQSEAAIKANEERIAYINSLDDMQKVQQFGSIDAAKIAVLEAEKAKSDAIKKTGDTAKKATEDQIKAVADMFGAMSQFLEEFAGQNEALGMLAKGLALFEIGLNTAKAVSGAIASAQSVPFPGNIAAIAVGVTSVLSAMVQAKQIFSSQQKPENNVKKVKKPKFHTGGLVTGGTEVDATLLTGESVMTRSATSMFGGALSAMEYAASGNGVSLQNYQGGQGLEFFKQAFAAALKEMPTPIVSVKEIERVQNRIRISEEIAKR